MNKKVKTFLPIFLLAGLILFQSWYIKSKPKILIFSKTNGYYHKSIPAGIAAIQKLGSEYDFLTDTTTDSKLFRDEILKNYAALVFLNTTDTSGTLLSPDEKGAFQRYIKAGGGFVGVHAATDAEYKWQWYGNLVGGYFQSHPKIQQATLHVVDASHSSTKHLPKEWVRTDEWYNFKNLNKEVHVLLTIDEKSYSGGKNGDYHPMAWWHNYDGGRAFYTELGHTDESYQEPLYLEHLAGGIQYAIGKNVKLNYKNSKAK